MTTLVIRTSFSQTTPESRDHGDISANGWHDETGETFTDMEAAADWLLEQGATYPSASHWDPSIWYGDCGSIIDYNYMIEEYNCFHLDGSRADMLQVARYMVEFGDVDLKIEE